MSSQTITPQVTAWDEFGRPITSSATPGAAPGAKSPAGSTRPDLFASSAKPDLFAASVPAAGATPAGPVARLVTAWDEHGNPITDDATRLAPAANNSQPVEMDSPTAGLPGSSVNPQPATPGMMKAAEIGIGAAATATGVMETHAAMAAGIRALTPALTTGVLAVGKWAEDHPVAAKAIYETLKMAIAGTIAGKVAKISGKAINAGAD
jgi:hypothetical protein